MNVARFLLFQVNLPHQFWSFAILHSVFLINRIPSKVLHNASPHELLNNKLPDLGFLKVFGCLAFACSLTRHRTKFDSRSRKCIFLGYQHGTKGFLLYVYCPGRSVSAAMSPFLSIFFLTTLYLNRTFPFQILVIHLY